MVISSKSKAQAFSRPNRDAIERFFVLEVGTRYVHILDVTARAARARDATRIGALGDVSGIERRASVTAQVIDAAHKSTKCGRYRPTVKRAELTADQPCAST
ncbi:hypothetical protein [Micromonospora narathiwatensis]|uniref:Uncharacterized protein n=1 Tax=Micromonospora narathiwatensis TaxID=299146 RepID=A0A1A8ZSX4_9ACTN|nr:hypothetical protein [Micromonospora narathiwatensis]SBT47002.1 hypothetical protein GA0070621_2779 [Micromonospora narathiwatensis]